MSKEELQKSLDALKSEIENLDSEHDEVRERVSQLISDVETQVNTSDQTNDEDGTLYEQVSKFVEQMEEHPIAETLNRFLTTLGEMGI